jgi:hypothetical protein
MRLWSIHPKYLDAKGFVALWREALLAQKVLLGATKGYKNHAQLQRFKASTNPNACIAFYLSVVYEDSQKRRYRFDHRKIVDSPTCENISVTTGQIAYEWERLKGKLFIRDRALYEQYKTIETPDVHPLFVAIDGAVETWEKIL